MTRIGIIGLGTMGRVHYEAYSQIPTAQVVAVADADPARAKGDLAGTAGNISPGGLRHLPMDRITGFTDYQALLALPAVEAVDICLPTPFHREVAVAALAAGKHVICEKPMARTPADARAIAKAAAKAKGILMPAQCMRFWPGWDWLKQACAEQRYGRVLAATFTRLSSRPAGWYRQAADSGGALLDLHIHDVDMINWLFGAPRAVSSRGYGAGGGIDHVWTHYHYGKGPLVVAEGGWALSDGFGFRMRYTVNFEKATADYDLGRADRLHLTHGGRQEAVPLADHAGYLGELRYFLACIERGEKPRTVTAKDGVASVAICAAEERSIATGARVAIR